MKKIRLATFIITQATKGLKDDIISNLGEVQGQSKEKIPFINELSNINLDINLIDYLGTSIDLVLIDNFLPKGIYMQVSTFSSPKQPIKSLKYQLVNKLFCDVNFVLVHKKGQCDELWLESLLSLVPLVILSTFLPLFPNLKIFHRFLIRIYPILLHSLTLRAKSILKECLMTRCVLSNYGLMINDSVDKCYG